MHKEILNMKELATRLIKIIPIIVFLFALNHGSLFSQNGPLAGQDFSITARNVVQTTDRTFEFDIFLLDTDAAQNFELASVQCGLTVNPAIYAGGTFSASIVPGTSGLNPAQVPVNVTYTTGTGANIIKLSAVTPPGSGSGTILSTVSPGTRVARIKVTSTVAFPSNSLANLAFTPGSSLVPSYATRVAIYLAGINTQLAVTPGSNATVLENPLLNSLFPVAYAVTGGGTCCANSGGLPVGLANSQAGTTYTLYRNDVSTGPTIQGTGTALNFPGNQTAGTYTVTATNSSGTVPMLNSVMVLMNPTPVPVIVSNSPICAGATLNLTGGPASMNSYAWSGPNGFSSAIQNPSIANATALASGNYFLTVTNSYGCAAATSTSSAIVVNLLPVPSITGPVSICTGATGINYSTEPSMTGYSWSLTGGNITAGTGTNSITVTWGAVGAGTVSVNYVNGNLCSASAPTVLNVTKSPVPVTQRTLANITVLNGQSVCSDAVQTIFVAGNGTFYTVNTGGISHLVAGQNVLLYPGTTVQSGGYLHVYIANDCLYCTAPKNSIAANVPDSIVRPDQPGLAQGNGLFRVFPNPTTGIFTVEMLDAAGMKPAHIELFGMQGRLVSGMDLMNQSTHTFDLGTNPPGLYIIRVVVGNEEKTARILKF